jgi:hypothetical protein
MTERYARDPGPGLADRIAVWLFPSLYPEAPGNQATPGRYRGPFICKVPYRPEPEPEAEAGL